MIREMDAAGEGRSKMQRSVTRLRQLFKRLVEMGFLPTNPATKVPLPKYAPPEINPMTAEQVRSLLVASSGDRHEALYWLALDTGARQGELLALSWADVDLDAAEVYFHRSLKKGRRGMYLKETKTPRGRRRVSITPETVRKLRDLRAKMMMVPLPKREGRTSDVVFVSSRGSWVDATNLRVRSWEPLLRKAGLPDFRFHDLRHTCATLLLLANVHPKVVSERLGHTKIEITLNTYSHLLPNMQSSAVAALRGILGTSTGEVAVK